ncbi:MAG: tRNA pseudouridine(55) synthase TruB [Cyanothece sp. SIO1E1]|nr:tRNA pseudouridine(55) synthase TruB [Cyanothece sp. SIO1E1]
MQGFLNLNKSTGLTSHDCVAKVRRLLQLKKVGHGGTLDPAATGVLPLALGRATRLLQFLQPDKAYRAVIRFGMQTTTDDLAGEPLTTQPVPWLTLEAVAAVLSQFQGQIKQIPPRYSAIQVEGRRLYDLARQGKPVDIPVRSVEVYSIDILDWRAGDFPELEVAIACGSGTYIRAIARDLGAVLTTGGTLAALTRTQSSGFSLAASLTLADLTDQIQAETFTPIAPDRALQHLPVVRLTPADGKRWCQGQRIIQSGDHSTMTDIVRVQAETGQFLGIGQQVIEVDVVQLIPKMVFAPG